MKVMISQPMHGLTDEEIRSTKKKATELIEKYGHTVVNSYFSEEFVNNAYKDNVKDMSIWFLAKSIEIMSQCDAVYFCRGWEDARGCKIEYQIAEKYGIGEFFEDYEYWGGKLGN